MNEITIFSKPEFGRIGVLTAEDGTPWFNAVDVCKALDINNPRMALKNNVDPEDVIINDTLTSGGKQKGNFINESGLYSLILKSRKPTAKEFKRWITSEVLPSIRKHGAYFTPEAAQKALKDPVFVRELVTTLAGEQAKVQRLSKQISADRPRVLFSQAVEKTKNSILVRDMARVLRQNGVEIGEKRLYQWLCENGYLCSCGSSRNRPTQVSMDKGLFSIRESVFVKPDGTTQTSYTTMVTGKGQVYFVNRFVHMTELELEELRCECSSPSTSL